MPSPVTDPFRFKYFHQVLPLGLRIKSRLRYCYAMEAKIIILTLQVTYFIYRRIWTDVPSMINPQVC